MDVNINDTSLVCPPLVIEHIELNTTVRRVGTVIGVTCKDGTELNGDPIVTCQYPGLWSYPRPRCKEGGGNDQMIIIIICSVATIIALGILSWAFYMLCANMIKERKAKAKRQEVLEQFREVTMFQAVSQDCVGMPPVVYDNLAGTLRGRPSNSEEESDSTDPDKRSSTADDSATDKAIIF